MRRVAFCNEPGRDHRLVKTELQVQMRALNRANAPGVFDVFWFLTSVFGEIEIRVGSLETWILENCHFIVARPLSGVFDVINKIAGDIGNAAAEHRVGQAFGQGNATIGSGIGAEHQINIGREWGAESSEDDKGIAAFNRGIPRVYGHSSGTESPRKKTVAASSSEVQQDERKEEQRDPVSNLGQSEAGLRDRVGPIGSTTAMKDLSEKPFLQKIKTSL